ncbi:MAG: hypothetical protein K0S38_121 [Candidatus Paceibacter sp.]|nr:hypothetical protein [Candidatus Paceibacter sp.]
MHDVRLEQPDAFVFPAGTEVLHDLVSVLTRDDLVRQVLEVVEIEQFLPLLAAVRNDGADVAGDHMGFFDLDRGVRLERVAEAALDEQLVLRVPGLEDLRRRMNDGSQEEGRDAAECPSTRLRQ